MPKRVSWFNVFAATLIALFAITGIYCLTGKLEDPVKVLIGFPENADIRHRNDVKPGTFTVEIPLHDLLMRARESSQRVLIAYGPAHWTQRTLVVEYWLPRTDVSGTFYYAENRMQMMESRTSNIGLIQRAPGGLIVSARQNAEGGVLYLCLAAVLGLIWLIVRLTSSV